MGVLQSAVNLLIAMLAGGKHTSTPGRLKVTPVAVSGIFVGDKAPSSSFRPFVVPKISCSLFAHKILTTALACPLASSATGSARVRNRCYSSALRAALRAVALCTRPAGRVVSLPPPATGGARNAPPTMREFCGKTGLFSNSPDFHTPCRGDQ